MRPKSRDPLVNKYLGKNVLLFGKEPVKLLEIRILRDWQQIRKTNPGCWLNRESIADLIDEGYELEYNYLIAIEKSKDDRAVLIYEPGMLVII